MAEDPESTPPWENPVRARLRAGHPVMGVTITTNGVEVAAQAAGLGFDFLWLEMEHSPLSLETVRNIVLATKCGILPASGGGGAAWCAGSTIFCRVTGCASSM